MKELMLFILVGILISSCQENKEKTFICNGNLKAEAGSAHREDYSVTLRGKEADFSKFACLGNGYSRDEKSVYILDYKIRGADPKTFKYITGVYAKDKNNIFYADRKIKKVDFETFEIVDTAATYSKDKNYVYYEDVKLKGADLKTFKAYGGFKEDKRIYDAEDKNYYYRGGKIVKKK